MNPIERPSKPVAQSTLILISLNSELLSEELFIDLMKSKCNDKNPLTGLINDSPWFSRAIESDQVSIISHLFLNHEKDICDLIGSSDKYSVDVSKTLISLLLDKSDNYRMLRREFFMLLITVK